MPAASPAENLGMARHRYRGWHRDLLSPLGGEPRGLIAASNARSSRMNGLLATAQIQVGDHITRSLFGLKIDVDVVWSTVVAGLVILAAGMYLRAKATAGVPGKLQLAFETIVSGVQKQVESSMGDSGRAIVPLAVSLL